MSSLWCNILSPFGGSQIGDSSCGRHTGEPRSSNFTLEAGLATKASLLREQSNLSFWNLYWEKSTVGGHYWFIIPEEDWEREEMKSTGKEKAEMKEVRQEEKVQQGS